MNQSLRRVHWRWMVFLAIALPLLLIAILGSRDFTRYDSSLRHEVTGQHRESSPETP